MISPYVLPGLMPKVLLAIAMKNGKKYFIYDEIFINYVKEQVIKGFGFHQLVFENSKRVREAVEARQITWYFIKKFCKRVSLTEMGTIFKNKNGEPFDHSTVIHGLRLIKNIYETNRQFRERIEEMEESITTTLKQQQYGETIIQERIDNQADKAA